MPDVGWPLVETRAGARCDGNGGGGGICPIGAGGQVLTVREPRSNRDAMAAPRAALESVRHATENAVALGGSARVGIGTRYHARDAG
jgi:hypothetical protein